MLTHSESERRTAGSRALMVFGVACLLSGLFAWGVYEHAPASTPALALYVPPAGLRPVTVPEMQTVPADVPSAMTPPVAPTALLEPSSVVMPMHSPGPQMAQPSARAPMQVDTPGAQLQQEMPPAAEPNKTEALMGPMQMLFWGLAASVAMALTVTRKRIHDRLHKKSVPAITTVLSGAEESLELGMLPPPASAFQSPAETLAGRVGRVGVPAMMAADSSAVDEEDKAEPSPRGGAPSMAAGGATLEKETKAEPTPAELFGESKEHGQIFGPTNPAHAWEKPWTNLESQEKVQEIKAHSHELKEPLKADMANDEIFVSKDSIHILKHHGSYMQQNRELKGAAKKESYQFMLRLKVPCGEVPGALYAELDDLSNKWGQGDLRATTRQAFQLHGVVKSNLKSVIAGIANIGSSTVGGCGDISRNVMTPPVHFANNPAYMYCMVYAKGLADLFKPMSDAFVELWLDGEKAATKEYWQKDIEHFDMDKVRAHDNGNGIITGHAIEPLYGRTYLPKKFKFAVTVPGDNSVDIYINDVGAVVIMEEDGETLKGFNIMVGGGLGRAHKKETTFARAASHLGFVDKDDFFEVCKAILAVQRDHGNREVRANARLKYLVHTLGIDDFRTLTEKYFGKTIQPWVPLPEWQYLDWMGWHEQGDGKWMFGINVEQGRVRDTPELQLKSVLRKLVDTYSIDMILTPSQSIVIKNIEDGDRNAIEQLLRDAGVKMLDEIDGITRRSMACPALPLCGLAMTEAERVQPQINKRLYEKLCEMGLSDTVFITRTTGCPNGCARPYMAEIAFVGSGPNMYELWLGGSPAQSERTAVKTSIFKMKLDDLEDTVEPIFAMYKTQRNAADEAFGDFCYRIGIPAIEEYMKEYTLGDYVNMVDPFRAE